MREEPALPTTAASGPVEALGSARTLRVVLGAAALAIVAAAISAASDIVAPLMLALALTILFHPLRRGLGKRMPSWLASTILLVGAYVLLVVLVVMLLVSVGQLATLLDDYQADFEARLAELEGMLNGWGITDTQIASMQESLSLSNAADAVGSLLSGLAGVLSDFFFLVTLLLFLAFDGAHTHGLLSGVRRVKPDLADAMASFARGTRSYLGVSAAFGVVVALIDAGLLWLMGVPGAFVWGVLAFVTNFIPNIGFVIGLVPPALIAWLDGGTGLMVQVIVMYCVVNFVIQSIIQPRVVGDAVGLSTTLTFLSLVFWTWILGPLGAILAVPMSLLVRAVLVESDPANAWMRPLVSGRPQEAA